MLVDSWGLGFSGEGLGWTAQACRTLYILHKQLEEKSKP